MSSGCGKIAILGGGPAGIAAAFELTSEKDWRSRYDITVYQIGWRLGGKCASGRNEEKDCRIEEHGLHVLGGFYDYTFRMLRQCYKEWNPPARSYKWTIWEAFRKQSHVTLAGKDEGKWDFWNIEFPTRPGYPGDHASPPTEWGLVKEVLWAVHKQLRKFGVDFDSTKLETAANLVVGPFGDFLRKAVKVYVADNPDLSSVPNLPNFSLHVDSGGPSLIDSFWRGYSPQKAGLEGLGLSAAVAYYMAQLEKDDLTGASPISVSEDKRNEPLARMFVENSLKGYDKNLASYLNNEIKTLVLPQKGINIAEVHHFWRFSNAAQAVVRGLLVDLIFLRGFDSIDHLDLRQWLKRYDATNDTLASLVINPGYDYAFAYEGGRPEPSSAKLAAGAAANAFLRLLLTYKGAIFYEMQASMAELVFTPLYDVLRARGVKFKFFHRVDALRVDRRGGQPFIRSVEIGVQAKPKEEPYCPLIDVQIGDKIYRAWPTKPKTDSLDCGDRLKDYLNPKDPKDIRPSLEHRDSKQTWKDVGCVTLEAGQDYDLLVLAIPIGDFRTICQELIDYSPKWKRMVEGVKTVQTVALQLWLNKPTAELGWPPMSGEDSALAAATNPAPEGAIMTSFAQPLNTWADVSHLTQVEKRAGVQSIGYFCGPLPDDLDNSRTRNRTTVGTASQWADNLPEIWPNLKREQQVAPGDTAGAEDPKFGFAEVVDSCSRENVNPSDRYVLSVPGSTQYRLRPDESGFANLYLAGDWTRSGYNIGCFEAAVLSGLQAGQAIKSPSGRRDDLVSELAEVAAETVETATGIVEEIANLAVSTVEVGVRTAAAVVGAVADALAAGRPPSRDGR